MSNQKIELLVKYLLVGLALVDRKLGDASLPAAVLFHLIEHDGPNGCYPSRTRLANLCHHDVSNIQKAINRLRDNGYISWKKRIIPGTDGYRSNTYTINYELVDIEKTAFSETAEIEEEKAVEEIAEFLLQTKKVQSDEDASSYTEAIRLNIHENYVTENYGALIFKLLRNAQSAKNGRSELDRIFKSLKI